MNRRDIYSDLHRTPEAALYRSQVRHDRIFDRMARETLDSQGPALKLMEQTSRYESRRSDESRKLKDKYEEKYGTPWNTAVRHGDPMPSRFQPAPERSDAHLKKYVKPGSAHHAHKKGGQFHETYKRYESERDTYAAEQSKADRWARHEEHRLSREARLYDAGYKSVSSSSSSRSYGPSRGY